MSTVDGLMGVIILGRSMRQAQKRYFRTRDQTDLLASKDLERQFDKAIDAALPPVPARVFHHDSKHDERT